MNVPPVSTATQTMSEDTESTENSEEMTPEDEQMLINTLLEGLMEDEVLSIMSDPVNQIADEELNK